MKFIPADDLINRVENIIPYFFESGMIDNAVLYNEISKNLGFLGDRIYPVKNVTLNVQNYKVCLPEDFYKEMIVYSCTTHKVEVSQTHGTITYEQRVCELPVCFNHCQYNYDDAGIYQIIQRNHQDWYTHKDLKCLKKESTAECCDFKNTLSTSGFKIEDTDKGKILHTGFKEGSVYLEYKSDSGELMVPDYAEIIDWLETQLIAFIFKRTWYNMDDTTYQRMQVATQDADVKRGTARAFWRRSETTDFKDLKSYLILRNTQLAHGDQNRT